MEAIKKLDDDVALSENDGTIKKKPHARNDWRYEHKAGKNDVVECT